MSRVLIVDDDETIIEVISYFFKEKGYLIDSTNFYEVVERFIQKHSCYSYIVINANPAYYEQIFKLHFQILIHRPDISVFVMTSKFSSDSMHIEALRSTCIILDDLTEVLSTLENKTINTKIGNNIKS